MTYETKNSWEVEEFKTGSVRDTQQGKPRYDLIPPTALKRVAELYWRWAEMYWERNWEQWMPKERLFASAMRHLQQAFMEEHDEDHLAAVVWNTLWIMFFEENEEEGVIEDEEDEWIYDPVEDWYTREDMIFEEERFHKEKLEEIKRFHDWFAYREE